MTEVKFLDEKASYGEKAKLEPSKVLLRLEGLEVHFKASRLFGKRNSNTIYAVNGIDLSVHENEVLGIIGESGCGKSTTGRAIVHLNKPTAGCIRFKDEDITKPLRAQQRDLRKEIQFVFQDPQSSLNSRMTVKDIIAEPLRAFGRWNSKGGVEFVSDLLNKVGLPEQAMQRYPHEFSGGQRQRIGIARALALDPSLLILDEPVSALDVSVQAQVLNLLMELQSSSSRAIIMISHDLDVVRHISDNVAVMYLGRIVEYGPAHLVLDNPAHPYTAALASATPSTNPRKKRERIILEGELPSAANPPTGCSFRTRCWLATERCALEQPYLGIIEPGRSVACHYPLEIADFQKKTNYDDD